MIEKDIKQITEEDLQLLITNGVIEGKTIEYKETVPGNSDAEKKEFLADVSSFVNTMGGDLIYGISEDKATGTPRELKGLDIDNVNNEITRLDSIIRSGIDPRMPTLTIQPVKLTNDKYVIIIRTQPSWISPHRVIFGGHDKFYSRSTNGKYSLDVSELRNAFILSESYPDKIRKFREERIYKLLSNETPVPLNDYPKTILHLMPLISFKASHSYPINNIASQPDKLRPMAFPMYLSGWSPKYNLDGFLNYSNDGTGRKCYSYVLLFRSGIVEAADSSMLEPGERGKIIHIDEYEDAIIAAAHNYLKVLKMIDVDMPVFVFITLIGVKSYRLMSSRRRLGRYDMDVIDRDILYLPDVLLDNYEANPAKVLRPCFDALWNACGYQGSLNYDKDGERHSS